MTHDCTKPQFTLNAESQAPASYSRGRHESIHCLCIVTEELPKDLRDALAIKPDELVDWLTSAGREGRSLVVLQTGSTIECYTTDYDRRVVLRLVLETLADKVARTPELKRTRTLERTGSAVARHLLSYAAEHAAAGEDVGLQIQGAAALSSSTTALGQVLASLFRAAANVTSRVRQETLLNDASIDPELRAVESLAVERIVEEELATWQAGEAEVERMNERLAQLQTRPTTSFDPHEPASEVRLRIERAISLLPKIE